MSFFHLLLCATRVVVRQLNGSSETADKVNNEFFLMCPVVATVVAVQQKLQNQFKHVTGKMFI